MYFYISLLCVQKVDYDCLAFQGQVTENNYLLNTTVNVFAFEIGCSGCYSEKFTFDMHLLDEGFKMKMTNRKL